MKALKLQAQDVRFEWNSFLLPIFWSVDKLMHSSLKLKFVPFASLCMCDFSLKMKLLTPFAKHPICHTSPRSFTVKINWDDFRPNSTISDHILPLTLNLFQSLTGCSKKWPQAAQLRSLLISRINITIPSITSLFSFCGNLIACLSDSCVKNGL